MGEESVGGRRSQTSVSENPRGLLRELTVVSSPLFVLAVLSDLDKRSMYDAGFLDLLEEDEGMGDFLHDLMNRMDKNVGAAEESLEDLQKTFVEMFGGDLAKMMGDENPNAKKRARDSGCSTMAGPKRNNPNVNVNGTSYHC